MELKGLQNIFLMSPQRPFISKLDSTYRYSGLQYRCLIQMQSQLYNQSQEQITPIVDYIPVQTEYLSSMTSWRMKQNLDESRERVFIPCENNYLQASSLKMQSKKDRIHTDNGLNDFDKKTTSIMQGASINTIHSNELSINTIRDNLKSYMTYLPFNKQPILNSQMHFYSNQNSNKVTMARPNHTRVRSRSIYDEKSNYFMKERSKLLKNIDKSLQNDKRSVILSERQKQNLRQYRKQRTQLIGQILDKLESSLKNKKQIQLVKSNCNETEVSSHQKQKYGSPNFNKKAKKWVETKNALRDAASDSNNMNLSSSKHVNKNKHIQQVVSQWKTIQIQPQPNISSPTLIPLIANPHQLFSQKGRDTSLNTLNILHKDHPIKGQDEIFTFSNLQNGVVPKHIKNVSITVSQDSSKEYISTLGQIQAPMIDCVLCKVIGKRCSFH